MLNKKNNLNIHQLKIAEYYSLSTQSSVLWQCACFEKTARGQSSVRVYKLLKNK